MFINIYMYTYQSAVWVRILHFNIIIQTRMHARTHNSFTGCTAQYIVYIYNVYIKMSQKSVGHVFLPEQQHRCVSYDTARRIGFL